MQKYRLCLLSSIKKYEMGKYDVWMTCWTVSLNIYYVQNSSDIDIALCGSPYKYIYGNRVLSCNANGAKKIFILQVWCQFQFDIGTTVHSGVVVFVSRKKKQVNIWFADVSYSMVKPNYYFKITVFCSYPSFNCFYLIKGMKWIGMKWINIWQDDVHWNYLL